jgi:2-C-methyl-D-erythritol 4-phosphate cytidylyltransferase
VAIHDAARPLVSAELFRRVFAAARRTGAAVPSVPLSDTVVTVDADGNVASTPDRETLRAVQTPQVARRDWLEHAFAEFCDGTDEGSLLVRAGYPVATVDGDASNIKLTRPFDLALAELLLGQRATPA